MSDRQDNYAAAVGFCALALGPGEFLSSSVPLVMVGGAETSSSVNGLTENGSFDCPLL